MSDVENLPFHRKYRPTNMRGYIGNEKIKSTMMRVFKSGSLPQVILLYGDSGCGKAQPMDSLVLTTSGYKCMRDIAIGDEVFTKEGNRGRVSGIYPQGVRPIYRITLEDRTYIDVSDEHLNCVWRYNTRSKQREDYVLTTNELIDFFKSSEYNLSIDAPSVNWDTCGASVPLDPYLVGALIGDDSLSSDILSTYDNTYLEDSIKSLGLDCNPTQKFIPREYLYNDESVRLALLQGLFDTVDSVSNDGCAEFSTFSEQLSIDLSFLVRSLGVIDIVGPKYINDKGEETGYGVSYKHFLRIPNGNNKKQHDLSRDIISIERIDDQECQCIMVDHPDHTYISDYFIPTHNTTFARLLGKEYSCYERDEETGACGQCLSCQSIDSYIQTGRTDSLTTIQEIDITDQSGKKDLDGVFEDMMLPSYGDEWKIYIFDECHKASDSLQNRLLKITEEPPEHVLMIFCTTEPDKLKETLLNRCQLKLQVKKPALKELVGLLRGVCEQEGVEYDNKGLEFIANRSDLTIRASLQNLWQVVSEINNATYKGATSIFEEVSNTLIIEFFKSLKSRDVFKYVTLLYDIKSKMELSHFLSELKDFVKRGIYVINNIQQDGIADSELPIYRKLFGDMGISEIGYLLNRLLSLNPNNLEMELLLLGYTGINKPVVENKEEGVFNTEISEILNELNEEEKVAHSIQKAKEEVALETGIENASNMMEAVDINDILGMGAVLVK